MVTEEYLRACKYSTYIGVGIAAFIMVILGFLTIFYPDPKKDGSESIRGGLFLILFAGGISVLAYFGAESACRNTASQKINSFLPGNIRIQL
jgi:hypothetical protein